MSSPPGERTPATTTDPTPDPTPGPTPDPTPGSTPDPTDPTAGSPEPDPAHVQGPDDRHDAGSHDGELLLTRLNRHGFRLVQLADAVLVTLAVLVPMWLRYGFDFPTYVTWRYVVSFALAVALVVTTTYFSGLYEREPRLGAPSVLPRAARAVGAGVALFLATEALAIGTLRVVYGIMVERAFPFPVPNLVAFALLAPLALVANRRLVHRNRQRREGPPRLLLVGDEHEVAQARTHLAAVPEQVVVVGTLDDPAHLCSEVARLDATDVALLSPAWLQRTRAEDLAALEDAEITALQRVTAVETMYGLQRIREVGGLPFVLLRGHAVPRSRRRFKRLFDLVLLVPIGLVALPVLAITGLYLLAVDGRPVLYSQPRVGAGGRPFTLVKFRTMRTDAELATGAVLSSGQDDPRVLPGAGWLRATRLDELPQLWNIARGEMSLVGPRPERPELTAAFEREIQGYARRHELPPGLTGLAQIHGRYHTDAEYKLGYDLQYLVNWSPVLDLEILLRTLWVVLARRV